MSSIGGRVSTSVIEKVVDEGHDYEKLALESHPLYDDIIAATILVKQYIRDNDFIVYGGTAIDFALRLHGDKIYPDDTLAVADLDFFTPDCVKHAYELADILYDAGYKDVRVVNARHIQTMRVDLKDRHWIADLSFIPRSIYDNMQCLKFDGMRVIHPHYQSVDLHSSLAFPYDNAPREVIFHRWAKDIKRFNLLNKYYPVDALKTKQLMAMAKDESQTLKVKHRRGMVYTGMVAYALMVKWYKDNISDDVPDDVIDVEMKYKDGVIEIDTTVVPSSKWVTEYVHFNTDKAIVDMLGLDKEKFTHHAAFISLIPESHRSKDIIVYDTSGRMLASNELYINEEIMARVSCVQYLLKHFMGMSLLADNKKDSLIYGSYYQSLLNMIESVEESYQDDDDDNSDDGYDVYGDDDDGNPFTLTIDVFGKDNVSEAYRVDESNIRADLYDETPYKKPWNYYPDRGNPHPEFNYDESPFFTYDGRVLSK